MSAVLLTVLFTFIAAGVDVFGAEIIRMSVMQELETAPREFSIERDIFSPFIRKFIKPGEPDVRSSEPPPVFKTEAPEQKDPAPYDIEAEVRESVTYEGYVIRDAKKLVLLSINQEFFVVGIDDIIMEKVKIINVEQKQITVEVDSQKFEIQLKGDDENEQL